MAFAPIVGRRRPGRVADAAAARSAVHTARATSDVASCWRRSESATVSFVPRATAARTTSVMRFARCGALHSYPSIRG